MISLFIPVTGASSNYSISGTDSTGPFVDRLVFNVITQADQQVLALQNDQIDIIGDMVDPVFYNALNEAEDIEVSTTPKNGYGYLVINCAKYPLNITAFRRAFALALDKQQISDDVWGGLASPLDSVIPRTSPYSFEDQLASTYYEANVPLGRQLLQSAGFIDVDADGYREAPDGSNFNVKIECAVSSSIAIQVSGFAADALNALGIDAVAVPTDFYEYLNRLYYHGDFDMVFLSRNFSDFDADWLAYEYWSEYADQPYFNFANFRNASYDSWRDQLLFSTAYEDVHEAAIEMQKILVYQCPEVVCYESLLLSAYRTDRFEGFVNDVTCGIPGWWTYYEAHLKASEGGPYGGVLRTSLSYDIDSFNFMVSSSAASNQVNNELWDSLIRLGPDGIDVPWLAQSFSVQTHADNPAVSEGHTRFVFQIVQNATWTDGLPFTAEDVAFAMNYYRDSPGNPYGVDLTEMVAAYAPTPYSVVIEFNSESYWNLHSIAYKNIIPMHVFEDTGLSAWNSWNPNPPTVTSGPFYVSDRLSNEFIELTRNPDYFGFVSTPLPPQISLGTIVFDYSHGQLSQQIFGTIDQMLMDNLTAMGFTVVRAMGGINSSILSNAAGFVAGSVYYDGYSESELDAISTWYNSGHKFMWIGYDSDFAGYTYINDNMTAILEAAGSHVYGEPLSVEDASLNAAAAYRPLTATVSDNPLVAPIVANVGHVLMHGPTCLYGSLGASEGVNAVALESVNITNVYPLLYYGENATIVNGDLLEGYTHSDGQVGAFVAATIELFAGTQGNGAIVVSGASPYGDYRPMCTDSYYVENLTGVAFVSQAILYGMIISAVRDFIPPFILGPADIIYNQGTTGHSINWQVIDTNPDSYLVYRNGDQYSQGQWTSPFENISLNVDSLPVGIFNFTIVALDAEGNSAADSVLVRVVDAESPIIDSPADIEYVYGETGNWIRWTLEDLNPATYELYRNNTLIRSGSWNSSSEVISANVDGLEPGLYRYRIVVTDMSGNSVSDDVLVVVFSEPPNYFLSLSFLITLGSVVVMVVVVILIIRAKGT